MTKGQSIVEQYRGAIVTRHQQEIANAIDAALREQREKCAEAVGHKRDVECYVPCDYYTPLILNTTLDGPDSPFGCECWRLVGGQWQHNSINGMVLVYSQQSHCQWCGKARVQ